PYLRARVTPLEEHVSDTTETEALIHNVQAMARQVIELSPGVPNEAAIILANIESPGQLADFLASNMEMPLREKQQLLTEPDVDARLRIHNGALQHQVDVLELSGKIQEQVRANIGKSQRQFLLQEQLKAIQEELGQADDRTVEVGHIRGKIDAAGMNDDIRDECLRELSRMENIPAASPEYNVIRTYLDWMTELPWSLSTADKLDVNRAERVLNKDHYDLQQVKRRVLEYLAVRKLAPESRGPILCFVGPPGVGKTSLGQSIARALGRKFIRMSLGGMRDEAELRGHRRTYIGAIPGRIIHEIRKAGSRNPVLMLDELDKLGTDFRGDPASALLEVLDPEQNNTFNDHYLEVDYDLSNVMFVTTANTLNIPPALMDRMEIIRIAGYTEDEKVEIARRHLIPEQ
ncbi:MAG: AAA family ATPase, partial [Phycisphaerae bacterium]|nr:AAA family ATPase [Phycisphaerae bacterium]